MPAAGKALKTRIAHIAVALDRSPITIKQWVSEGMDIFDPESVIQFYQWKNSRLRNKPNHERPARRYRPPC